MQRRAIVGAALGAGLALWPAAWPDAGAAAQELVLEGKIPAAAGAAALGGDYAYLGAGPTLRIYDISDPAAPVAGGSVTLPANIYDIAVAGTTAYVAMDFDGLATLDVADPAAPRLLGTFRTPGQALSVAVAGTTAAVTNRLSGLELVDVSDPAAPTPRGSYFAEGYAIDVAAADTHAYVVDTPGGLSVIDLAAEGEEIEAAGGLAPDDQPVAVAVAPARRGSARLAVLISALSELTLVDVSDPAAPDVLTSYSDPARTRQETYIGATATSGLVHLALADGRAFLADVYPPFGVHVVDLSDPAAPAGLTTYPLPGPPGDLVASSSRILVPVAGAPDGAEPAVLILRLAP